MTDKPENNGNTENNENSVEAQDQTTDVSTTGKDTPQTPVPTNQDIADTDVNFQVKLPVIEAVTRSFDFFFKNLSVFAHLASVWIILGSLLTLGLFLLGGASAINNPKLLEANLSFLLVFPFIVSWHRVLVMKDKSDMPAFSLGIREFRFLGRMILLGLIYMGTMIVPILVAGAAFAFSKTMGVIFGLSSLVFIVVAMFMLVRLTLALPAVALDRPELGFGESWKITRGNTLRIIGGNFLLIIPVGIVVGIASGIAAVSFAMLLGPLSSLVVITLFTSTMIFAQTAIQTSYITHLYLFFTYYRGDEIQTDRPVHPAMDDDK